MMRTYIVIVLLFILTIYRVILSNVYNILYYFVDVSARVTEHIVYFLYRSGVLQMMS